MESNEIISELCKEAAQHTPDVYDKILNAAKAQDLINSSGSGSASVEVNKITTDSGATKTVAKVAASTSSKTLMVTIIGTIATVLVALAFVLTAVFCGWFPSNSHNDGLGNSGSGSESSEGNEGEEGNESGSGSGSGDEAISGELKYVLSEDETYYECAGFKDEPFANVVIASEYEGLPVKGIASRAFYLGYGSESEILKSVTIPDSVTYIDSSAFDSCKSLSEVTLSGGLTTIGEWAFSSCSSLKNITIPDSVAEICDYAFCYCRALTEVTLSDGLTTVGEWAFAHCFALESLTLPDSVTDIGNLAFYLCAFESFNIPKNVTSIGAGAFWSCDKLTSLTVDSENTVYYSLNDNCIIERDSKTLNVGLNGYVIPNDGSVTVIGSYALAGRNFDSFNLPECITSIGSSAFYYCESLKSINLPESLTYIGANAFNGCSSLESIVIPSNVTEIEEGTFDYCKKLKSVTLNEGLTSIGDYAFMSSGVTEITFPSTLTYIGHQAFSQSDIEEVTIPSTVNIVGTNAFWMCRSLTKATIYASTIFDDAFVGCGGLSEIHISTDLSYLFNSYAKFYSIFGGSGVHKITYDGTSDMLRSYLFGYVHTFNESEAMEYSDFMVVHCSDGVDCWLEKEVIIVEN